MKKKRLILPVYFFNLNLILGVLLFIGLFFLFHNSRIASKNQTSSKINPSELISNSVTIYLDYIVITETPVPSPTPKPTATPKLTLTPIPVSSSDLESLFTKYSSEYGVSKELLRKIAFCESKFNSSSTSKYYAGLFQFSVNTWINTRREMNMNDDLNLRLNAEESIKTAAFKLSRGGVGSWPNCQK